MRYAFAAKRALSQWWLAAAHRWVVLIWLLPVIAALWSIAQAPSWREPSLLTVHLQVGESKTLGRKELWAPRADDAHILLNHDVDGQWRLRNQSANKRVLWQSAFGGAERDIREWPLLAGSAFTVGGHGFTVMASQLGQMLLQEGGRDWQYDGVYLRQNGLALPECRIESSDCLYDWLQKRPGLRRPLRLGGGVYCADRLGLSGIVLDTVTIAKVGDGFVLRPGTYGSPESVVVNVSIDSTQKDSLWQLSTPLALGDRLIIGRTEYEIKQTVPVLVLAVLAQARRWLVQSPPPSAVAGVTVTWRKLAWLWPDVPLAWDWRWSAIALPLVLGLGLLVWRPANATAIAICQIGLTFSLALWCLALHFEARKIPLLWPYISAWPVGLCWLTVARSDWSRRLLAVFILLVGMGLVALLQLGIGTAEDGWQRYGGSGAALMGAFGWFVWATWSTWRRFGWPVHCSERRVSWILTALGVQSLLLLLVQMSFGDEAGWLGWQPFQLTQLILVLTAAWALALRGRSPIHGWSYAYSVPWLRYLGPLILFAAIGGFALIFLHDFSPLVLLGVWVSVLIWAYLRAHPLRLWRWAGQAGWLALVVVLMLGVGELRARPALVASIFKTERILVWTAPEQYPHAGYQLRRALEAIRAGGWSGTVWRQPSNGRVMMVPVIESDFAPTFFLSRYGGLAGLLLMGIQTLFIVLLAVIAERALKRNRLHDASPSLALSFYYFTIYGGAALIFAHYLVSWGTNLGFLPVMGQPMPLLSAAGSHLVLLVLPIVAFAVAVEERTYANSA